MEARAVRRAGVRNVRVIEAGIALSKYATFDDLAISCGLAGGLRTGVPTGTVLLPRCIRRPDGSELQTDAHALETLTRAAESFGYAVLHDPMVTSASIVQGPERATWAAQGYAAVDMETGLIQAPRVACVRVVLDTPEREISPLWIEPRRAMLRPAAWRDLPFLMREGPRCSQIAARIAARAAELLNRVV